MMSGFCRMKDKIMIRIKLTRDFVCMGDDVEDHTQTLNIAPSLDTLAMVYDIAKRYLPTVAGRGHSWDCIFNGKKIAIIQGNCRKIRSLSYAVL